MRSRFAVSSKQLAYRSTFWISLTSMRRFALPSRAMERRAETSLRQNHTFVCLGFDVAGWIRIATHRCCSVCQCIARVKVLSIRR